ncbi:MAG: ATP-binding protein [Bacteroidia bacterium]
MRVALSAILLFVSVGLLLRAIKLRSIDRKSLIYQLGAALCVLGAVLAFIEYEISQVPITQPAPYAWSKAHSLLALWTLYLSVINAFIFSNLHWSWPRIRQYLVLGIFIIPPILLSILFLFTDFYLIAELLEVDGRWGYVLDVNQSLWHQLWIYWQAAAILMIALSFGFSYRNARTTEDRVGRGIFFSLIVFLTVIILGVFVLLPAQMSFTGQYLLSIPTGISIMLLSWIYVNYRVDEISEGLASTNVMRAMTNIMLLTDENFIIREVNPATIKAFQIGRNLLVGLPVQKILKELEAEDWQKIKEKISSLEQGEEIIREIQIRFHQRQVSLILTISPAHHSNKRKVGYVFLGTDMTQFKQVESMLIEYTQQLEKTNEELERFAYIASHDLKTPIRNISAFLSLIERRLPPDGDPELKEFLDFAVENSKHAYTLIQDVLEYSRTASLTLNLETVSLNHLFEELKGHFSGRQIHQRTALLKWDDLPEIRGDKSQLKQLFQNLIENGFKYNKASYPEVYIQALLEQDSFVISIKDNGIGIREEYQAQIFGMFKRLHTLEEYPGTGIGLAICEKIVKAHGGEIWLESQEDVGTTFFIRIPFDVRESLAYQAGSQLQKVIKK